MITWKRTAILMLAMFFVSIFIFVGWHGENDQRGCKSSTVREEWSSDRAYKATLLRKSCNIDESIFYSIRLDSKDSPTFRPWFVPGFELENDEYPENSPVIHWVNNRKLEILVHTRTLSGSLSRNIGDDLVVVRSYIAKDPNAFPNY